MGEKLYVHQDIHSSLKEGGSQRKKYGLLTESQRVPMQCEWCGKIFYPKWKTDLKKRFCGTSCSAKWRMSQPEIVAKVHTKEIHARIGRKKSEWYRSGSPESKKELERIKNLNPCSSMEVRMKISKKLKQMGWKPLARGGNGTGMTFPQRLMRDALCGEWIPEYAISLGKRQKGYPTNYKVDLANLEKMIAIEVDGHSHRSRKEQDKKKDAKLNSLGWKVLRFSNQMILDWINIGKPTDSYISLTLASNGIQVLR